MFGIDGKIQFGYRSMVVKPQEDERTWLKFASLCRKSGRLHLSHKTLVSILGCDPSKNPTDQPVPSHHPQVKVAFFRKYDAFFSLPK